MILLWILWRTSRRWGCRRKHFDHYWILAFIERNNIIQSEKNPELMPLFNPSDGGGSDAPPPLLCYYVVRLILILGTDSPHLTADAGVGGLAVVHGDVAAVEGDLLVLPVHPGKRNYFSSRLLNMNRRLCHQPQKVKPKIWSKNPWIQPIWPWIQPIWAGF